MNSHPKTYVIAGSVSDVAIRISQNISGFKAFSKGEWIATPVCALVRNDVEEW